MMFNHLNIGSSEEEDRPLAKYFAYVIELDPLVADRQKFRRKNPGYIKGMGVYVGQSSRKPELRFEQHKEGYKSNNYAKVYGIRLRPELYEKYNPIPSRKDAEEIEEMLGKELRKKGVGSGIINRSHNELF